MHQHDIRRMRRQRLQPGADAVLARRAAGDRGQVGRPASGGVRSRPASQTGCSRLTCSASSASAAWRSTGLPGSGRNCFGVSAPNRVPARPPPGERRCSSRHVAVVARATGAVQRHAVGTLPMPLSHCALPNRHHVANLPKSWASVIRDTTVPAAVHDCSRSTWAVACGSTCRSSWRRCRASPICRSAGSPSSSAPGMVVSEMIASWAMIRENRKTLEMAEMDGFGGLSAVQLAGCEPGAMAEAARLAVDRGADLIDINFGCPVKKVAVGQQAGSALMRDEAAAAAILEATVRAVARAGDAEDAHGLGPCQPERAAAGPHRPGLRHPHGHRAWPHPPAVLYRDRRLGLHRAGEGRGGHPGDRQRRHPDRGGCRRGAAPIRRRRGDDRPRLLRPALVHRPGGALPAHRPAPAGATLAEQKAIVLGALPTRSSSISATTPGCAWRASMSPGIRGACPARPNSARR